jgi:hypothetical protein
MAGNWLATRNKDRAGLVEGQYRFDISNIEGAFEKEVNLLWRGCRHWLVDNNIRSCTLDDSLQFGLLFGGDRELAEYGTNSVSLTHKQLRPVWIIIHNQNSAGQWLQLSDCTCADLSSVRGVRLSSGCASFDMVA